jgi:replicative DNA helicase
MLTEQRTLPHSEESERAVLGAILLDPELLAAAGRRLAPDDFYLERHQALFTAMVTLRQEGATVDARTVQAKLEAWGAWEQVGGIAYLAQLDLDLPDLGRVDSYVEIVKERATRRRLIQQANGLIRAALEGDPLPEVVEGQAAALETARRALGGSGVGGYRPLAEVVYETWEALEGGEEATPRGFVSTGLQRLDAKLGNLGPGWLVVIAGRPGTGKTALALQMGLHNALAGRGVAIQTMEDRSGALVERMFCHFGEVGKTDLRLRQLTATQWRAVVAAGRRLSGLPMWIDSTRRLTAFDICARLRRLAGEHPVDLAIIDYLTLLQLPPGKDRRGDQKLGDACKAFLELGDELGIPILLAAQFSRAVDREGRAPRLSDLKETGELEQDAHVALLLHREPREDDPSRLNDHGRILVAKNRGGDTGGVPIIFQGAFQRFREPSSQELEEEAAAARAKRKPKSYE